MTEARWYLTARCPRCSKVLWWRKLATSLERAAWLAIGCSGLRCARCGDVDARHMATLTNGLHPTLRPMGRGIAINDNGDTEETGT